MLRRVVARAWVWIVVAAAVIGVAAVSLGAGPGSPTYESTGTYIVRSRAKDDDTSIQAMANLNGTVRIDTTFARIAESKLIADRAWQSLGFGTAAADAAVNVDATVTRSANILSISARTTDPDTAHALATAVGAETIAYIDGLADLYDLKILDPPSVPRRSSSTALLLGPVLLAGILGVGVGLATRSGVRRRLLPRSEADPLPGIDTAIDSERYTHLRLQEERSRTDSNRVPFHVLVLHPDVVRSGVDIPAMASVLAPALREEDHLGYLDEIQPGTFVAIVPGRSDQEVEQLLPNLRARLVKRLQRIYGPHARVSAQSYRYADGTFSGHPEAIQIVEAL